jgi:hypothetical protein
LLGGLLIVSAFSYVPNPEQSLKAVASSKDNRHEVTRIVSQENTSIKPKGFTERASLSERPQNVDVTRSVLEEMPVDTSWKFQSFRFFHTNEDVANRGYGSP